MNVDYEISFKYYSIHILIRSESKKFEIIKMDLDHVTDKIQK